MLCGDDAHGRLLASRGGRRGRVPGTVLRRRGARGGLAALALASGLLAGLAPGASRAAADASGSSGVSGVSGSGVPGLSGVSGVSGQGGERWVVAWTSAMAWQAPGPATNATVRQVVPLSAGGTEVRVQLSNLFGAGPLDVGGATVAVDRDGPAVDPESLRTLSFGAAPAVTIPAGRTVTSDPVDLPVHAGEELAVSVYVSGTAAVTAHYDAGPLSYGANDAGNLTSQASGEGFGLVSTWDRWVSAVMVANPSEHATVVFGDSISDGFNDACGLSRVCGLTTPWPVVLARRLQAVPDGDQVSVVDESITANTLTPLSTRLADEYQRGGGGPPGLTRLAAALALPGVDRLVMLLGTNDLWFGATANQVIAGYERVLAEAQAAHVGVIGVTLLPRAGSEGWTPTMERYRQQVNRWILTSGRFPAVIDLAAVVADVYDGACDPTLMYPPYDSGDHLHPNTAGQTAMADAIPTSLLGAGAAPLAAPLIAVTPTPHCAHPAVVTVNAPFPAAAAPTTTVPTTVPATTVPATTVPATTVPPTAAPPTTAATTAGRPAAYAGTGTPGWALAAAGAGLLLVAVGLTARRGRGRRRPSHRSTG
ncbi:MAG: GDSL-type esterase/lipase family protein [Acidimicrobiales bacterium]